MKIPIQRIRLWFFHALIVFSEITLTLTVHLISSIQHVKAIGGYPSGSVNMPLWTMLGTAISGITTLSAVIIRILDVVKGGKWAGSAAFELVWISLLQAGWFGTAITTAATLDCSTSPALVGLGNHYGNTCALSKAAEAFMFLTAILCKAYWIILLVCTIMLCRRGELDIHRTSVQATQWERLGFCAGVAKGGAVDDDDSSYKHVTKRCGLVHLVSKKGESALSGSTTLSPSYNPTNV